MKRSVILSVIWPLAVVFAFTSCDSPAPYPIYGKIKFDVSSNSYEGSLSDNCQVITADYIGTDDEIIFEARDLTRAKLGELLVMLTPDFRGTRYPTTLKLKSRCYNNIKRDAEGKITEKTQTGETISSITIPSFKNPGIKGVTFSSSENLTEAQKAELKAKYNYTSTSGIWPVVTW